MPVEIRKEDAPGVYRAETDRSGGGVVPLSSRSVIMVGAAATGPTNQRIRLRSQADLNRIFGIGSVENYGYEWYAANDLLEESDEIYFLRVSENNATPASKMAYANRTVLASSSTTTFIGDMSTTEVLSSLRIPTGKGNTAEFILPLEEVAAPASGAGFVIAATSPGSTNNLVGIEVVGNKSALVSATVVWGVTPSVLVAGSIYKDANNNWWKVLVGGTVAATEPTWSATPGAGQQVVDGTVVWLATSEAAERDVLGLRNRYPDHWWKMLRLRVVKKSSASITSFAGLPIVDEFFFTLDDSTTGSGETLFIKDVVNGKGTSLVYALATKATGLVNGTYDPSDYDLTYTALANGQDGTFTINTNGYLTQVLAGWDYFKNREYVEWFNAFDGRTPEIDPAYQSFHKANAVCKSRVLGRVVGQGGKLSDLRKELVVATSEPAFAGLSEPSRGILYCGWDLRVDSNTGKKIWLPKSIEGVRAILKTNRLKSEADAPAGAEVAICKGIDQNIKWTKEDIGYLYSLNINPSAEKAEGNVIWGQKTCQRVESRRNRVNVRTMLDRVGADLEQIGDTMIWRTITPKLIERLFSQFDRYLDGVAPTFFDTRKSKGYRLVVDDSKAQQNRLDVRVEVLPVGVFEWLGVDIIVTDEGAFLKEAA